MQYKKEAIAYNIDNLELPVTNILVNVDIEDIKYKNIKKYALSGETAQDVSLKLYGTSEYYWVLYLLNDIVNPFEDWYMSQKTLKRYVRLKYDDPDAPNRFYYIDTGETLTNKHSSDMLYLHEQGIRLPKNIGFDTNFDYESKINETKKIIIAINNDNILDFINKYNERLIKL